MGMYMKEDDIFIPSLFEQVNLRFAPRQGSEPEWFGGVEEVADLQKKFQVFRKGRSFHQSASLLGLGGHGNPRARARWFAYLDSLNKYKSNRPNENGDEAVVNALIENLAHAIPLPVHFKPHDAGAEPDWRVIVGEEPRPLFYMAIDYLTVSFPARPHRY